MNKTFNVSFPEPLAKRLDRVIRKEGTNRSDLLQSLARDYLKRKERWAEFYELGYEASKKLGIRTMDDIVDIVHEFRKETAAGAKTSKRARRA